MYYRGKDYLVTDILNKFNWQPILLQSKEGLALLNGTQFMSAYGIHLLLKSYKLSYLADLIGSISLDAFDGRIEPFFELVHLSRPHNGQISTAKRVREFLDGSELINKKKNETQIRRMLRDIFTGVHRHPNLNSEKRNFSTCLPVFRIRNFFTVQYPNVETPQLQLPL